MGRLSELRGDDLVALLLDEPHDEDLATKRRKLVGSVENLISSLVGGVQAGMGYCGVRNIRELQRKARFIRITDLGLRESHVHDVVVTKEAPNYRLED